MDNDLLLIQDIYEQKGHFKPHRDTPRGEDFVGTLVVCLPSYFSGGSFIVRHQNIKLEFDWSEVKEDKPTTLHWVAFFGA